MPVTDFECAIAKSQIARFIAGENLGADVENQLESHIDACPKCRELLEAKKQSLMQEIEAAKNNQAVVSNPVSTPTPQQIRNIGSAFADPVPTDPSLAEQNRMRAMLSSRKTKKVEEIEIPAVAAAFAPKDGTANPSIKIRLEEKLEQHAPISEAKPKKDRSPILSKLALFRRVPSAAEAATSGGPQPPITMEALKAANKQLRNQDGGFTKPLLFMLGLAVIVGAMSYVVKDPTKLLGTKAIESPVSKKTTEFVASKKSESMPKAATSSTGVAAQNFLDESIDPATGTATAKPKAKLNKPIELTDSAKFALQLATELTRIRKTPAPIQVPDPSTEDRPEPKITVKQFTPKPIKPKTQLIKRTAVTQLKKTTRAKIAPTMRLEVTAPKRAKTRAAKMTNEPKPQRATKRSSKESVPKAKKISTPTDNRSDSAVKVYDSKGNPIQ